MKRDDWLFAISLGWLALLLTAFLLLLAIG
jgi:hypothetical protein